ncbi:MAG: hypothetical protein Q4G16_12425 [Cruoricaptor ignavus]|nr:hypothetical protein [Cruoricaptor ignavus]
MTLKDTLQKLSNEKNEPCITISLNTHRTHPENLQDEIVLKNLIKEAKTRVETEYGARNASSVLEKLDTLESKIDINHNQESLHIFLSNDTEKILKSPWKTKANTTLIDETFAVKPVIKAYTRSTEYLILLLAKNRTHLYHAVNDDVTEEVKNAVFPFAENPNLAENKTQKSDAQYMDNLLKEHYRDIDKALVNYINEEDLDLSVVVISTADNYNKLLQASTQPAIYVGHDDKNYHEKAEHHIAKQAWEIIKQNQKTARTNAIAEAKEAVSKAQVVTDLNEIYQAAIDGRGDLLIVHQDYEQAVKMIDDRNFEYAQDPKEPGVLDDIVSTIAWEVLSKKGRVFFTSQEEIKDLGNIVLKVRY